MKRRRDRRAFRRFKSFRIKHVEKTGEGVGVDRGVRVIGEQKFGDQLEFEIDSDRPVYAYLVAFRPDVAMEMVHSDDEKRPRTSRHKTRRCRSSGRCAG